MRNVRWLVLAGLAATLAAATLALAGPARAAVTIGPDPLPQRTGVLSHAGGTIFATGALPGATLASPIDGAVVRWRVRRGSGGGAMPADTITLRILRGTGIANQFTAVGTSAPHEVPGAVNDPVDVYEYPTRLPIAAGDRIGLGTTSSAVTYREETGTSYLVRTNPLADGETATFELGAFPNLYILVNADVQPPPTVSSINPTSGPSSGGTAVTIAGSDFADVSAVDFGGQPAASYSVDSESQIHATSPAAPPGPVDVTVTTVAGKSATGSADVFTYNAPPTALAAPTAVAAAPVACLVPKLKNRKLRPAKRVLRRRHCRIGKVIRKHRKKAPRRARVIKQRPRPRTVRPAGTKVHVWLRVKKHRKRSAR
jgi:hypothetical protein